MCKGGLAGVLAALSFDFLSAFCIPLGSFSLYFQCTLWMPVDPLCCA